MQVLKLIFLLVFSTSELVRSAEGAEAQKKLWTELSATLEKILPGIMQNI